MSRLRYCTILLLAAGVLAACWNVLPAAGSAPSAAAALPPSDLGLTPSSRRLAPDATTATGWRLRGTSMDGFDLVPQLHARFADPLDPDRLPEDLLVLVPQNGSNHIRGMRYVLSPDRREVRAWPSRPLQPATRYDLVVRSQGRDEQRRASFVTMSSGPATPVLRAEPVGGYSLLMPDGPVPAGGHPFVVFAHGAASDRRSIEAVAPEYLEAGLAVAAPAVAFAAGAPAASDVATELRAGAGRLVGLHRDLAGADVDGDGSPDLAQGVGFLGESFGAAQALLAAATVPGARVVLSAPVTDMPSAVLSVPALQARVDADLGPGAGAMLRGAHASHLDLVLADAAVWQLYGELGRWSARLRLLSPEVVAPTVAPERVLVQTADGDRFVRRVQSELLVRRGGWSAQWWHARSTPAGADGHAVLSWSAAARRQSAAFLATGVVDAPEGAEAEGWTRGVGRG